MIAPKARNGPKGILISRLLLNRVMYITPAIEPMSAPKNRLIQHPAIPTNDPTNASSSRSPWPMPSLLVSHKKIFDAISSVPYPNRVPARLLMSVMGNQPIHAHKKATGIKKMVTYREMSIVSRSERMLTMRAEKKIK